MHAHERLIITLPVELAEAVRAKVGLGPYRSADDVVRGALRAWSERERILDAVRAKIDEADLDPRPSLSEDEVERHLAARFAADREAAD